MHHADSRAGTDASAAAPSAGRWGAVAAIVVTLLCLLPFAGKAIHVDDPLFLWTARQIQAHPADPYGFAVNWYGWEMPMAEVTKNPPGASYYLALVAAWFGWSEVALHLGFLFPAVAVAWGTWAVARRLGADPALAALATVLTPGFLVSATTLMSDTTMLALWLWAAFFWLRGVDRGGGVDLSVAVVLAALAALTKYFGVALLGLFFVYALQRGRGLGRWVGYLLIPLVMLFCYQWATHALYGRGLLLDAAAYATARGGREAVALIPRGLVGLAFTGGCAATLLFFAFRLASRRVLIAAALVGVLVAAGVILAGKLGSFPVRGEGGIAWVPVIQFAVWVASGLGLFALVAADLWSARSAESLFLLLWVCGTFVFAAFVNWTINARSLLPLIPAAGILLSRRIRLLDGAEGATWRSRARTYAPLVPAALLALSVAWADHAWAASARDAAVDLDRHYRDRENRVRFLGHWGFQHYMESLGYEAMDLKSPDVVPGDVLIVPTNNTNTRVPEEIEAVADYGIELARSPWLATMQPGVGAGFYAHDAGPLPFAFGAVAPERYRALRVVAAIPRVGDPDLLHEQALELAGQGRTEEAVARFREVLRLDPDHAEAHYNVGTLLAQRGDFAAAAEHLSAAIAIRGDYAIAHYNLANVLLRLGDTEGAKREQETARHLGYPP